jgi:predicted RNase H-like HicB family nuclease
LAVATIPLLLYLWPSFRKFDNKPFRLKRPDERTIFLVEEDPEGGYTAQAVGENIFTQGETMAELKGMIRDAVACHYDSIEQRPTLIRLHFVKEEVFAL